MNATTPAPAAAPNAPRRKALKAVAAVVVLGALAYGVYWALVLNHFESTDNAYVQGTVVQITPQVGGTVVAIGADDNDPVQPGQTLVRLDAADARVALEQAQAQLAQAVREVRGLMANNSTLKAQITVREADVARTQQEVARTQDDVNRRAPLVASGAVGKEDFEHAKAQADVAKSALAGAQAALATAREQLLANQTQTDGIALEQHPNVLRAASRVREAHLALQRMELLAPVGGVVAKRSVQLGQRVAAGAPLMSVVGLHHLWVEANFKESQLKQLRLGQSAELVADVYGKSVTFHGKVTGLGAGTGAAFALLPAQNATGNWIKVVQRVPVHITLDAAEVAAHPLRVGLSMQATVDVSNTQGLALAEAAPAAAPTSTAVFDAAQTAADADVARIIKAHGGTAATAAAPAAAAPSAAPPAASPAAKASAPVATSVRR